MSFESGSLVAIKSAVESVLRSDKKFGGFHEVVWGEGEQLVLTWNDQLRAKTKNSPGPYLEFMEAISDCLVDFGYALFADEGATETERNNYLLILPDDEDMDDED